MSKPSSAQRFQALLEKQPDSEATYILIPFDVQQVWGTRARVPVRGTINGVPFRTSISPYGGRHYLGVIKSLRDEAQAQAGDRVEIVLERDEEPRQVTLPEDFEQALQANPAALSTWKKLSYTHQKETVNAILEARKPETRTRRIEKSINTLSARYKG